MLIVLRDFYAFIQWTDVERRLLSAFLVLSCFALLVILHPPPIHDISFLFLWFSIWSLHAWFTFKMQQYLAINLPGFSSPQSISCNSFTWSTLMSHSSYSDSKPVMLVWPLWWNAWVDFVWGKKTHALRLSEFGDFCARQKHWCRISPHFYFLKVRNKAGLKSVKL